MAGTVNALTKTFLISLTICAVACAQEKTPKKPKKLAWPKLSTKEKGSLNKALRMLRSDDEETIYVGQEKIADIGPGAVPTLYQRLANNSEPAKDQIREGMRQLIEKRHAPLLVKYATRKQVDVRRITIEQLAKCFAPKQLPVLQTALKDKDTEVRFYAALGLAGLGEFKSMSIVFDRCKTDWRSINKDVDQVLRVVRSAKSADWVLHKMRNADEVTQMTGLRLLRSLAPKDYAGLIKPYLDSKDSAIKKEAINALRVVFDGKKPLEKLSVFQAIQMAKEWKAKV